jgi:membrane associated rhomboid family serine protease
MPARFDAKLLLLMSLAFGTSAHVLHHGAHTRPIFPHVLRQPIHCCSPAPGESDAPSPSPPEISALDLSSELAKYNSRGLRVRQSRIVRKGMGGISDVFAELRAIGRFLCALPAAVQFHRAMLVVLVACFGMQSWAPRAAMLAGARVNSAVLDCQWHRLLSPVFLHGGWMHLLSNAFSLWRMGPLVEASYGTARTALLYLLAGLGGNLAGLAFGAGRGMSVGASGAVFGMIGATGGYVLRNRRALGSYGDALLTNCGQILLLNLFIGTRPGSGIDNIAHLGGVATGLLAGVLVAPAVRSGGRGRWERDWEENETRGDGAILPQWCVRGLLGATLAAYAIGLREATRIALAVTRVYGRS